MNILSLGWTHNFWFGMGNSATAKYPHNDRQLMSAEVYKSRGYVAARTLRRNKFLIYDVNKESFYDLI